MRDRGEMVAVVSIDLSRAFDMFDVVQHELLLAKLKPYDAGERSCALLKDYLTGRQQRVTFGDTFSKWKCVMGPMFFNLFINPLFYHVKRAKHCARR